MAMQDYQGRTDSLAEARQGPFSKTEGVPMMTNEEHSFIGEGGSGSLQVKDGYNRVSVNLDDIRFITSDQNYAVFYLANGKRLMVRSTLMEMIERLPSRLFLRVNRGTIVNVGYVTALHTSELYIGDVQFNISRTVRESVKMQLTPR